MRALWILLLCGSGCLRTTAFHCASDTDCAKAGVQGTCETSVGYCSFADPSCPSGQRYGDLSGPYAQACVDAVPLVDSGVPDASAPDASNDTDGDGIANAVDNCPTVANPNQDNEDGDKFGDACDPCPPINDNNPPDADGDGVADACDPNPATAGDSIFLFEGFKQSIPAGWDNVGNWTASNGDATTIVGAAVASLTRPGPVTGHETVSTSVRVDSTSGNTNTVGIVDDRAAAADSAIACGVYHAPGGVPSPGLALEDTNNVAGATVTAYQMSNGRTYSLIEKRVATSFTCAASTNNGSANIGPTSYALANNPPSVGFRMFAAGAHYHWLMVVTSP